MVTFLHLSDIHFIDRDQGTQFDRDQLVRRALLEDLHKRPEGVDQIDGVLITGDIAYHGLKEEYARANDFLDQLHARSGAVAANTYMVPGNHDIDRTYVAPSLPLFAAHARLRQSKSKEEWHDQVYQQLVKDPLRSLLAPLKAYNDFAQGYGCVTGMVSCAGVDSPVPQISWQRTFGKPLDDGTLIRIHGLNSVVISDEADEPGKMLVSDFQTSLLEKTAAAVNIVMCHHPPEWLMDKAELSGVLQSFVPVSLFGHEHQTNHVITRREVRLFSGAVQPSRRDPNWRPTYHILQLGVERERARRQLVVRIYTREFTTDAPYRFRPRRNEEEQIFEEARIDLPEAPVAAAGPTLTCTPALNSVSFQTGASNAMTATEPKAPTLLEVAQHQLLVDFFKLPTPKRYEAAFTAGLLRDGDDALNPLAMWAEVFRRAEMEQKLAEFWAAVAKHSAYMKELANPFVDQSHA